MKSTGNTLENGGEKRTDKEERQRGDVTLRYKTLIFVPDGHGHHMTQFEIGSQIQLWIHA